MPVSLEAVAERSVETRTATPVWCVVQTKPRLEERVLGLLLERTITPFLPRLRVWRRHGSRRWEVLEPLFPGYVFCHVDRRPEILAQVRWAPGVKRILGDEDGPIPVPEEVIHHLQERQGPEGYIVPSPSFIPGTRVRVTSGPLLYLEGIIERPASRAERVRVLLQIMGRYVPVEVDVAHLEKLE
jgi:transcription antitermination factor NusG